MAGAKLKSYNYNYINATCELSYPFTSEYYIRIIVTTSTTINEYTIMQSWYADKIDFWEEFPDDGSDTVIYTVDVENINVEPNTEYQFYYYAQAQNGQYDLLGSFWLHTPHAPLEIVSIIGIDRGECVLTATNPDNIDFVNTVGEGTWYLYSSDNRNGDSLHHSGVIDKEKNPDGTYTYYFFLSGTYTCNNYYDVCVWFDSYCIDNESGIYANILSNTCTFFPYPNSRLLWSNACFSISKTDNAITMNVKDQSDYLWSEYVFMLYKDDVLVNTITATSTDVYSFSGLEEGAYKVISKAFYNGSQCHELNSDGKTFNIYERTSTFTITASRPGYFYWTTAEKNAFTGKGATTELTAVRWNAFVDNINDILRYKGLTSARTESELYGVPKGTYMDDFIKNAKGESGGTFYANCFNIARHSIGAMNGTGILTKYSGDKVLGSEFITLQNKLNEVT